MSDTKTVVAYSTIPLSLVILLLYFNGVDPAPTHLCKSSEKLSYCFSISNTRCYRNPEKTNWKSCTSGWEEIPKVEENDLKLPCTKVAVLAYTDNGKFYCDGIGEDANCVKWEEIINTQIS